MCPVRRAVAAARSPAWSPDGERIVFTSYRDGPGELYVMDADGSNLINLTQNPANDAGWPAWWAGELHPPEPVSDTGIRGKTEAGLSALMGSKKRKGPGIAPAGDRQCPSGSEGIDSGEWSTAAPDDIVVIGDSAQIGLRHRAGQRGDVVPISAIVIAPDGSRAQARSFLEGDEWTALIYPEDFSTIEAGGPTFVTDEGVGQRGEYTVIWESQDKVITCDQFLVGGGAS